MQRLQQWLAFDVADELIELNVAVLDVLDKTFLSGFDGTVLAGFSREGAVWAEDCDAGVCLEGEGKTQGASEDGTVLGGLEFDGQIVFYRGWGVSDFGCAEDTDLGVAFG